MASAASGLSSGLHWDVDENLHGVLTGTKHAVLCAPACGEALGATRYATQLQYYVDAQQRWRRARLPSVASTSDYARRAPDPASTWRADLQAGDWLYIPAGWWHDLRTEGLAVAVNFWAPSRDADAFAEVRLAHTLAGLRHAAVEDAEELLGLFQSAHES